MSKHHRLDHFIGGMRGCAAAIVFTGLALVAGPADAEPSGQPIRVGGSIALTGPLASTGLVHKLGADIFIEQINKGDGLLGRPVEWVLLDDQSKPDLTRTLYERLITADKVDLLIGPYATGSILSAMAVAAISRSPGSRVHLIVVALGTICAIGIWHTGSPICWLRSARIFTSRMIAQTFKTNPNAHVSLQRDAALTGQADG